MTKVETGWKGCVKYDDSYVTSESETLHWDLVDIKPLFLIKIYLPCGSKTAVSLTG